MKRFCGLLLTCLACAFSSAHAQARTDIIGDSVECSRCLIQMRDIAVLGGVADDIRIAAPPDAIAIDGLGRYWIVAGFHPPQVFSSRGNFVGIPRFVSADSLKWQSPLDVRRVPGDSMLVLDAAGPRALIVDSGLRVRRIVRLPEFVNQVVPLRWPSTAAANGAFHSSNDVGWPLHLMSFSGPVADTRLSFGPDSSRVMIGGQAGIAQKLVNGRRNTFWSADFSKYRLTLWDSSGNRIRAIVRNPTWFRPVDFETVGGPSKPPTPSLSALEVDDRGRLWVFIRVASPNFRSAWPATMPRTREFNLANLKMEKLYDTIVEVIDPIQNRVVARTTFSGWIFAALPGARAAVSEIDAHGVRHVRIVALTLVRS